MNHSIERTSPKGEGEKFVGTCRLCGTPNLTLADFFADDCPNQRGLSEEEALLESISPASQKDKNDA